jgi:hypothetical protein
MKQERITPAPDAEAIAFAEALARAHVARDIAAARALKDSPSAHRNLRSVQHR